MVQNGVISAAQNEPYFNKTICLIRIRKFLSVGFDIFQQNIREKVNLYQVGTQTVMQLMNALNPTSSRERMSIKLGLDDESNTYCVSTFKLLAV